MIIDGVLIKEIPLQEPLGFDENPHIIFGAGNFPKNNFNLNYTDIDLHEFKLTVNDEILSHHTFEKFIHFLHSFPLTPFPILTAFYLDH